MLRGGGDFPRKLVCRGRRLCINMAWLESASGWRRHMNLGTILVALAVAGFGVYVFTGIKRGWIK